MAAKWVRCIALRVNDSIGKKEKKRKKQQDSKSLLF